MTGNMQKTKRRFMRESTVMKIHYITGVAALFTVAVHILMRLIMPFSMSLEYDNVVANYQNFFYVLLLESILVLISIHGFNGLNYVAGTKTKCEMGKVCDPIYLGCDASRYRLWNTNNYNR